MLTSKDLDYNNIYVVFLVTNTNIGKLIRFIYPQSIQSCDYCV